jgi:hypothetical protein
MSIYKTEQFIEKATKKHCGKYSYEKSNYINARTKISILCSLHGSFNQLAAAHLRGKGCPRCGLIKSCIGRTKQLSDFIFSATKVHGKTYCYDKAFYNGCMKKVKIICNLHGIFQQKPNDHLSGKGCPKCVGKYKTSNEFIDEAKQIHKNYSYTQTKYIDSKTPIDIYCQLHGIFSQKPTAHLRGQGCPKCRCKSSKGEKILREVISHLIIDAKEQYRFPYCIDKKALPFDFAIFKNQILLGVIEFQGEQHYKTTKWGSRITDKQATEKLQYIQKHDQIKTAFCREQNIPLLIIPYWKENDITVLTKHFVDLCLQEV